MSYPKVFDAAYPPASAPPGMAGVMGYIGGNTPHVWTPGEWRRFTTFRQFPVWVADLGGGPVTQGQSAVSAARRLGWAAHLPEPQTRVIILDMEASVNAGWYAAAAGAVEAGGFVPVCYGSQSVVLENAAEHVIAADWGVFPVIPPGQSFHGLQYEANVSFAGTVADYSVFDQWLFGRGGLGARHGA